MQAVSRSAFRTVVHWMMLVLVCSFSIEGVALDVHEEAGHHENVASLLSTDQPPSTPVAPDFDGHSLHICHCVHAHVAIGELADAPTVPAAEIASEVAGFNELCPPGRDIAPMLRPPITTSRLS